MKGCSVPCSGVTWRQGLQRMAFDIVRDYCHTLVKSGNVRYPDQSWDGQPNLVSGLDSPFTLAPLYGLSFSRDLGTRAGDGMLCCSPWCPVLSAGLLGLCLPAAPDQPRLPQQQLTGAKGAEGCPGPAPCPRPAQPAAEGSAPLTGNLVPGNPRGSTLASPVPWTCSGPDFFTILN